MVPESAFHPSPVTSASFWGDERVPCRYAACCPSYHHLVLLAAMVSGRGWDRLTHADTKAGQDIKPLEAGLLTCLARCFTSTGQTEKHLAQMASPSQRKRSLTTRRSKQFGQRACRWDGAPPRARVQVRGEHLAKSYKVRILHRHCLMSSPCRVSRLHCLVSLLSDG